MKELKTIQDLKHFVYRLEELKKLSRQMHKLNENSCNYGLTPKQEKRDLKLQAKSQAIAQELGLKAYFQGDPRGCALYLVLEEDFIKGSNCNYTDGIAVY